MSWTKDKVWSDRYVPQIKSILGQVLICVPSLEEDQLRNTDLMVFTTAAKRIACRVRKHRFASYDDITIRSRRPSGNPTELRKIYEGWGDWIFYGYATADESRIGKWVIGDLNVLRGCLHDNPHMGKEIANHDRSSWFRAYRIGELPSEFVVESS